jgi:hypothetical protein
MSNASPKRQRPLFCCEREFLTKFPPPIRKNEKLKKALARRWIRLRASPLFQTSPADSEPSAVWK